jgi:carbon monoxide dehydrogenase subunit G
VRIIESAPPDFCRFEGEIQGKTGTIEGEAAFQIEDQNGYSLVSYTATGVITGALSLISPRFIEGAVNSMIKQGLAACEKKLRPVSPDPP